LEDRGQLSFFEFEDQEDDIPLVYVASALSSLGDDEQRLLDAWCELIHRAVVETASHADPSWSVRVHMPITWSAPWVESRRSAEAVYHLNASRVLRAAALVVIGYRGGSLGAGQEFAWASHLRVPVLYLRPAGMPLSRQIEGTPVDLVISEFTSAALYDTVSQFVRSRRGVIEDHPRQLRNRMVLMAPLALTLRRAWQRLEPDAQNLAVAMSRIHRRRIVHLVSDPLALAACGLTELLALSGALGVDAWRTMSPRPLPDLEPRQLGALTTAAGEFGWDGPEVLGLYQAARLELARGGTRRLPLSTVEDWVQLREAQGRT
jgi:hypothetical protein